MQEKSNEQPEKIIVKEHTTYNVHLSSPYRKDVIIKKDVDHAPTEEDYKEILDQKKNFFSEPYGPRFYEAKKKQKVMFSITIVALIGGFIIYKLTDNFLYALIPFEVLSPIVCFIGIVYGINLIKNKEGFTIHKYVISTTPKYIEKGEATLVGYMYVFEYILILFFNISLILISVIK